MSADLAADLVRAESRPAASGGVTVALERAMSDRDAAGRALGDLIAGIDLDRLPAEIRAAAQEYADLAMVEDLAFAAQQRPDLCPRCGEPYARHTGGMRGPHGEWACYYDGTDPDNDLAGAP